jgi:ABC-type multidrug transport system fused ATPase/permease subunit
VARLETQRRSILLMPPGMRIKYGLAAFAQVLISLLDLIGIIIMSLIGYSFSVSNSSISQPSLVSRIFNYHSFSSLSIANKVSVLLFIGLVFFTLKSILALYLSKKTFDLLARHQANFSRKLVKLIHNSDYQWLRRQNPNELANSLVRGSGAATVNALGQTLLIFAESTMVFSFMIIAVYFNFPVGISMIAYLVLLVFILNSIVGNRIERFNNKLTFLAIQGQTQMLESINMIRELRILGRLDWFEAKTEKSFNNQAHNYSNETWIQQVPKYFLEFGLIFGGFFLFIAIKITTGIENALPMLFIYFAGAFRIFPAILRLQSSFFSIRGHKALAVSTLDLYENLLKNSKEYFEHNAGKNTFSDFEVANLDIEFVDVNFSYESNLNSIIKQLSMKISRGENIAIIGPSGAGKSTFLELALGLLEPSSGKVLIGKIESAKWIRSNPGSIAYVPQNVSLISGTLRDNILFGLVESPFEVELLLKAIHDSNLATYIASLPAGLETYVHSNGTGMSGGQRQRIGLARALYSQPKILVLDEPTSSLDEASELEVLNALDRLEGNITIITVTHSVNSKNHFDKIIRFGFDGNVDVESR